MMLYVVATPIGNLEDITLRALRVLREVDLVAAEDTRHTRKLLERHDIHTPLTSYHEHNERTKAPTLVRRLEAGEDIALVSDAGTPTISDPGYHLIRAAAEKSVPVTPVPGASAATAALSVCGLATDRFVFQGFLPGRRNRRREMLRQLQGDDRTMVFYEAPHRIRESLADMHEVLGDRAAVVGRELTKVHEELLRGTLSQLAGELDQQRGEFVVVVAGRGDAPAVDEESLRTEITRLLKRGQKANDVAKLMADSHHVAKRDVYKLVLEVAKGQGPGDDGSGI
ncbi:MAG: 16S rRNA (cytidine(1402)-2'-O)-methyltransferase [Deltaproteobacteria bacterium]|nr:16S rRNA (cytidine(1402)-2'-O)-methyltransferase [Deltaproteobacteria bacterium]